jgi:hypothetical protein
MSFKSTQSSNRVTAVFQYARRSFEIEREVTLGQLAERLFTLGEMHGGLPVSVDVRVVVGTPH